MWSLFVNYVIRQGNVPLTDIIGKCNNLAWSSDADTLATTLTFDSLYDLAEGRTHIVLKKDSTVVFMGVIVSKQNKHMSSSYTAMDYAFYLNKNQLVAQFNTNAKDAIQSLCSRLGIKNNITQLNTKIKKIYNSQAVSDIIKDILEQCKNEIGERYIMEMQEDVLYVQKLIDLRIDCKLLLGKDYTITRSMEDLKNRIIIVSNKENSTRIIQDVSDQDSISTFGQLAEIVSVEDKDVSQAKNIANNNLLLLNRTKKEFSIPTVAIENGEVVKADRMIFISIPQYGMNGWYEISTANHSLQNNIHKIDLTIDFS